MPALQVARLLLSGAKNSRLTQRLVYRTRASVFATPAPTTGSWRANWDRGPGPSRHGTAMLQRAIDEELRAFAESGPTERELQQAKNAIEASFLRGIETVQGKADQLNQYYFEIGTPDGFQRDLDRFRNVTTADVQRVVQQYLTGPRAIVSVVPLGKREMAAEPRARALTP